LGQSKNFPYSPEFLLIYADASGKELTRMPDPLIFLLASPEPAQLSAIKPILADARGQVEVALSAEAALSAMSARSVPALAVIDEKLPGMDTGQLLATVLANPAGKCFPIVIIADCVTHEWANRLQEGVIDDVILRSAEPSYWRIRVELVLRLHRLARELDSVRDSVAASAQLDRLTGVYNRETLLSVLFRETDRVQRQNNALCIALFDIDDFGHWNSRLGAEACDDLLRQVVARTMRLLRSYDAFGRLGKDEFLVVLPGCSINNALMLAERLRIDVFSQPFRVGRESIRLSACFGLATSLGRSPVVVLREAEQALALARQSGPETIQCFADSLPPAPPPVTFMSPTSGDELLAW
jgi:two-component system cell cycle response regulator